MPRIVKKLFVLSVKSYEVSLCLDVEVVEFV